MTSNFHIISPVSPWGNKKTAAQQLREQQDAEELLAKLIFEAQQNAQSEANNNGQAVVGITHEHFKQIRKHHGHHDVVNEHHKVNSDLDTNPKKQNIVKNEIPKQEVSSQPNIQPEVSTKIKPTGDTVKTTVKEQLNTTGSKL
jgi:hypothetical protein